jgi:hypothetical protein
MKNQIESSSSSGEFKLFSKFPAELRRIIWLMMLPAPRPHVSRYMRHWWTKELYLIDRINQESRYIFKSLFTKLLPPDTLAMGWSGKLLDDDDARS